MLYSIIIPVYNVEAYLHECVNSILNQSHKDYEIILVDDGSTDISGNICDDYANAYENIRVIHQINSGQAHARNKGLKIAKGDYIIFLDSDDFIIKGDFLEKLSEKVIFCPDLIFYKFSKFIDGTLQPVSFSYKYAMKQNSYMSRLSAMVKTDAFYGMAWIKAIRRDLLIRRDIFFDPHLVCEDMDWNYALILNAETIELIDESYIAYRQRESSVTKSITLKTLDDFIYTIEKWANKATQSTKLKSVIFSSLAKYYSNLLIAYNRIENPEKKQYLKSVKKLSFLLSHSLSKRPRIVNFFRIICGFNIMLKLLNFADPEKK